MGSSIPDWPMNISEAGMAKDSLAKFHIAQTFIYYVAGTKGEAAD